MTDIEYELEIQRCVDGELSDDEQQTLLARLEGTPGGWRTLALAYVEHQVWGDACRNTVDAVPSQTSTCDVRRTPGTSHRVAVAAALVIAVGCGFAAGQRWNSSPAGLNDLGVTQSGDTTSTGATDRVAQSIPQPVMNLEFVSDATSDPDMTIPVFDRHDLGPEYWNEPQIMPADVRQALSRRGYDVRQQREFMSFPLDDGRQIAVPVDTVLLQYRGL